MHRPATACSHSTSRTSQLLLALGFLGGWLSSCEKTPDTVIDSAGWAPSIISSALNPTIINTDTINIGPERDPNDVLEIGVIVMATVSHPISQSEISSVSTSVYKNRQNTPRAIAALLDNGVSPDTMAADSVFSARIQFQIVRSEIGIFSFEIASESVNGYVSNSPVLPLMIVRQNQPPVLSNLQAPDTVRTSQEASFVITVDASDPDGLADIRSVTRTTPSNLVLHLNDTGSNGDTVPGDGTYSEIVSLSPAPAPGSYLFRFQALDRSNEGSNIILHTIIVLQ